MVRLGLPRLKGSRSNSQAPSRSTSPKSMDDNKNSTLVLKTTVTRARNLAAKDRGGTSDPYLVVSLGDCRFVTHAVNKTLNPEWNVSFDFPLNGPTTSILECVCWDKDRFGKDYLGEFEVPLDDVFTSGRAIEEPKWFPLVSKRKGSKISGEVELQLGLIDSANPSAIPEDILQKFQGLIAGTPITPSNEDDDALDREGGGYADEDDDDENENEEEISDETDDPTKPETAEKRKRRLRLKRLKRKKKASHYELSSSNVVGVVFLEVSRITDLPPEHNMTRTGFDMDPFVVVSLGKKTYRTRVIRHNLNPVFDEKMIFQVMRREQNFSMSFSVVDRDKLSGNDFVAQCSLALQGIISTAPEADTETGLYRLPEPQDMPNLSPQSSRSRFKLPLSRSSSASSLTKLARPGLQSRSTATSQSYTGTQPESALLTPPVGVPDLSNQSTVVPAKVTDDNQVSSQEGDGDLKSFTIPLILKNKDRWEAKHSPELIIRAKYVPYPALRQQFWRALLKQYDADDSGRISKVELSTMLDTLGSTLKESTIDGFFKRYAKENEDISCMELTFDQAVICLEDQLDQSSQERSLGESIKAHLPKVPGLPTVLYGDDSSAKGSSLASADSPSETPTKNLSEASAVPAVSQGTLGSVGEEGDPLSKDDLVDEKGEEHVIEITECPICHQPRLDKRSDTDIITHIATCVSQDWRQVNNIVMAGFVTSTQAQRKWYSKVITKISYGGYKLGANSANILVQDRITGQINEERMSVYVRLGIRLLYKGLKSREMEKKRIRKLLKSLSVKQGKKYDDPLSSREINSFIAFHQLDMSEVLLPVEQFKSFNEFFYRALKPGQRPCSAPDNPKIIVSPADCRSVVFNTIDDAARVWIKGREFSVSRLLGKAYPEDAKRYVGGALGIFRLAPQDYHRFHIPVDGTLCAPKTIEGEYYTVNPMAIRSALDVYGENVRVICPINSVAHGRVMMICVGAMMVGSTVITAIEGQHVKRAEELGYFKFGGSTIILLFEPGSMKFDEDLVENSSTALETLIRVGMSIGHSPEQSAYTPDMRKENVTQEERQDAQRRIGGDDIKLIRISRLTDGSSRKVVLELPILKGPRLNTLMTCYATRQPLQTLVMATQPPARRRSARLAFGEDGSSKDVENGGSAPKRTKRGDDAGKISSGKTNGTGKKKLTTYDEEDDGFVFRRTRSTRTKAAPAQAGPIEVEAHRPAPKRKTFLTPVALEKDRMPRRRKSPGEAKNETNESSGRVLDEPKAPVGSQKHMWNRAGQPRRTDDDSIAFVGETQAAAAAARDTTKIQIPFADTPVINRNKQLRQQHGQGHRRSSVGLRGRRASSLIENGSTAPPHSEVDIKDFYKHISEDGLSEPRRMKQLLTWCGTRALGEKPSYSSGDGNARLAARVIQEELLKDFSTRSEMSDWFNRRRESCEGKADSTGQEDSNPAVIVKKPNPQNASNAAKIQVLEAQLKRIEEEKNMWLALQKTDTALSPPILPTNSDNLLDEIDSEALDSEQVTILASLRDGSGILTSVEGRLKRIASTLEFTVDQFADGLHKLGQYHEAADRTAGRVLALAAERLDRREKATLQAAGTENMPLQDVLRSLARIER